MIHLYRIEHWLFSHHIPFVPKIIQVLIYFLFNSKVPYDVDIKAGSFFVCRGISVILVPGTHIGKNCVLGLRFSTVRNFPYKEVPTIKDNVWIGPNVVVAGPVIIEDNVVIAANSFVNKSVPAGCIVAGNPAKIIGYTKNLGYDLYANPKYKEGFAPYLSDTDSKLNK